MAYRPCHTRTSLTFAITSGQNTLIKLRTTSRSPPSLNFKPPLKVPFSTARTNIPPPSAFTAPCLYYQSIEQTFQDPSIFEQLPDEPTSIVTSLVESLQRQHGKAYPWAVGSGRQLPSGYILAKRKKDFRSARPIISFVDSPFRPMLNILARLIFQLIPVACPNHFATGDVYTLLSILKSAPVDADLVLVNQDLAGFFDQDRFVRPWFMLLDFLRPNMNVSDNEAFSVYPGKSNNPRDIIKGRTFRRLNVTRKIIIKDVPDLIKSALNMQTFALGQKCVRQCRGSPMGSPLSPALCLMVVSISEQIWSITFNQLLSNHKLVHPPHPLRRQPSHFWRQTPHRTCTI